MTEQEKQDIEISVLGLILIDSSVIYTDGYKILSKNHFKPQNQAIFECVQELSGQRIDLLSVTKHLRETNRLDKVGGFVNLSKITSKACLILDFEERCYYLHELFIQKNLENLGSKIQVLAKKEACDTFEKVDQALEYVREFNDGIELKKSKSKKEVLTDLVADIKIRAYVGFKGVRTHINEIDERIGAMGRGDLIIVAGRPAMGKTSLALSMSYLASKNHQKGLFFSLEMKKEAIYTKLIAIDGEIKTSNLFKGTLSAMEEERLSESMENVNSLSLEVIDDAFSLNRIISVCYEEKQKNGIDYVIVDYLQLVEISQKKGNREQEVSFISRQLKLLAMKLDIPVIALSQLSRSVESRPDKKPQLSDLRESGSIEQDASIVMFCYRPAYYELQNESGQIEHDVAFAIVAKNRNGKTGAIQLEYDYDVSQSWGIKREFSDFLPGNSAMKPNEFF